MSVVVTLECYLIEICHPCARVISNIEHGITNDKKVQKKNKSEIGNSLFATTSYQIRI